MKTKHALVYLILTTMLFSACAPILSNNPTATPLPTAVPVTELDEESPEQDEPTPGEMTAPEVVRIGDLTMEIYELVKTRSGDDGSFNTTAGPSREILKTRRPLRDIFSQPFSPPPLNGRQLTAAQHEIDSQMVVTAKLDDEEVLSVIAGDVSPIGNLRGTWVIDDDWYVEVAQTENEVEGNNVASFGMGDIIMNGTSFNKQYGYDESFGFQPLDDKPFYFFSKDGEIGISYAGEVTMLGFDSVEHYACCSAGVFNPKAYLTMVTFFASKGEKNYYVELGLFSAFELEILDLSGAGLTIEAFELQDGSWPDNDHIQSRPTGSLPGWVMKRHEIERKDLVKYQDGPLFQGKVLSAGTTIDYTDAAVEVRLDDEVVLSVPVGDLTHSAYMDLVSGVWVHGEHWYMEMAHVEHVIEGNIITNTTRGEIFRSGESLSQLFGYDETFDFQILAGEPFYFFRKGEQIGLNYAGEEVLLGFDEVARHYCCGFGIYNPRHYENMTAFFASREGERYYVEAGVFE